MKRYKTLPLVLVLLLSAWPQWTTQAVSGMPGSLELGFAARMDAFSPEASQAVTIAHGMGLDWVILEVDWRSLERAADGTYNLQPLQHLAAQLASRGMYALVSIMHAPPWALTSEGPQPQATADLALQVAALAPDTFLALELFPMPNTKQGWGSAPNPRAYTALMHHVHLALQEQQQKTALVVGGLLPLRGEQAANGVPASDFLQALYQAGIREEAAIIGLAYPILDPQVDTPDNPESVLRSYSKLRLIMLQYGHRDGVLWVTRLAWQPAYPEASLQSWVQGVYGLLRNQVYIGLVGFDGLTQAPQRPIFVLDTSGDFSSMYYVIASALSEYTLREHITVIQPGDNSDVLALSPGDTPMLKRLHRKTWYKRR